MTVSRSGVTGLIVGGLVLLFGWPAKRVGRALLLAPVFVVVMRLMVPGLVGTIRNLFGGIGSEDSSLSRINAQGEAFRIFRESPVFGRGLGTFVPQNYLILDDQWLGSLVQTGVVGLAVQIALFAAAFFSARRARRRSGDPRVRELGLALSAAIATAFVAFATFDAFSFPMASETAFLLIGACGALLRLTSPSPVGADVISTSRSQ
jgi:O-antigen ligase